MILFLGQGYVASHLKKALVDQECWGTSRTPDSSRNVVAFNGGITPELQTLMEQATHILISIPPVNGVDLTAPLFKDVSLPHLRWMGYLSATSVYGDHQGRWVDETSETQPTSETVLHRLEAEKLWENVSIQRGLPLHIFRLSGIYGPHRSVFDRLDRNKPTCVHKDGVVFSRIHVNDIVRVLLASMEAPNPQSIYNLADDEPASPCDVMAYACHLLGLPSPTIIPFEEGIVTPQMANCYRDSKRVLNAKIKEKLKVILEFSTYREGLQSILRQEGKTISSQE